MHREKGKIRILYIVTSCKKTGPIQQTLSIIKNLDIDEFEPILVTLYDEETDGTSQLSQYLKYVDHFFVRTSKSDILLGKREILEMAIDRIKPDIIHSLGVFPDYAIAKFHKYPHIITLHNYIWDDYPMMYGRIKGGILARLHLYVMDHTSETVTCSESLSIIYRKKTGKSFRFIRNGVDISSISDIPGDERNKVRKELAIPLDAVVLVYSGKFIKRKNQEFLIKAFDVGLKQANAKLLLLGDGPEYGRLKNVYGSNQNIIFKGNVLDVGRYLKACDIYVSTSKSEGMPYGVLEAMAAGLPVLLSDIMQHKEIMKADSDIGFLYRKDDLMDLSKKLKKIIDCNFVEMGQHSYSVAYNQFSAIRMSREYQEKYKELVAQNSKNK